MHSNVCAQKAFSGSTDEYFLRKLELNQTVWKAFQTNRVGIIAAAKKNYPETINFNLPLGELRKLVLEKKVPASISENDMVQLIIYDQSETGENFTFMTHMVKRRGEYILYADFFTSNQRDQLLALASCHLFSNSMFHHQPVLFQLKRKELKDQDYEVYFKAGMSEGWNPKFHESLLGFAEVYNLSSGNRSFLKAFLSRVDSKFWKGHELYSGVEKVLIKRGEFGLVKKIEDARRLFAEEERLAQEEKEERRAFQASLPEQQYQETLDRYSLGVASSQARSKMLNQNILVSIDNWPGGCRWVIDQLNRYPDITVTTNTSYEAFHKLLTPVLLNDNGTEARGKLLSIFYVLFSCPDEPDRNRELLKTIVDQVDFAYDFMGFLTNEERNDHFATGVSKAVRAGEPIPFSLLNQILTRGMLIGEYRSYFDFPSVAGCRSGTRLRLMILLRKIDLNDGNKAFLEKLLPVLSEECWLGTEGDSEEQSWIGFKEILLERGESDLVASVTKARNAKAEE